MNNVFDMLDELDDVARNWVQENTIMIQATKLGLDERCGTLFANENCIIATYGSRRNLDYYGGFEYIDSEFVKERGNFIFYLLDGDRVDECLEHFREVSPDEFNDMKRLAYE